MEKSALRAPVRERLTRLLTEVITPHVNRPLRGRPAIAIAREELLGLTPRQWGRFAAVETGPLAPSVLAKCLELCKTEEQRFEIEDAWYADVLAWEGLPWMGRSEDFRALRAIRQVTADVAASNVTSLQTLQEHRGKEGSPDTLLETYRLVAEIQQAELVAFREIKRLLDL